MSWDKIENHLFHRYDVEGEDKELSNLMEEHDKEVGAKVIDEFLEALKPYKYGRTNGVYIEIPLFRLDEIVEQIKVGVENESKT